MSCRIFIVIIACLAFGACSENPRDAASPSKPAPPQRERIYAGSTAEDQVKNVILRYDQLLIYGYDNLNMNPLQEVTTADQAQKAYHHMAAIGEGGVRMTSHLNKIDFIQVTLPQAGKAVVKTREIWDFAYNDIKTGVKKEEQKDFVYLMEYTLEYQGGRWLITQITTGSEEKPARKTESRRFQGDGQPMPSPTAPHK